MKRRDGDIPREVFCDRCHEEIDGPRVAISGRTYHPDCYAKTREDVAAIITHEIEIGGHRPGYFARCDRCAANVEVDPKRNEDAPVVCPGCLSTTSALAPVPADVAIDFDGQHFTPPAAPPRSRARPKGR